LRANAPQVDVGLTTERILGTFHEQAHPLYRENLAKAEKMMLDLAEDIGRAEEELNNRPLIPERFRKTILARFDEPFNRLQATLTQLLGNAAVGDLGKE
jgi:hypothetical protein